MIGQSTPKADDLMVLLTVARLGKFKAAANVLNTTHTTVSRRISELDRALGGRTLVRGSQGWELTPLGATALRVAEEIERSLSHLADYTDDAPGLRGLVRVSTPDGIGSRFVSPAAVKLQQANPALSVEVVSSTRRASQHRSGVDIEVVIGRPSIRQTMFVPLSEYYLRLYATPQYLERNGTPETIDDLRRHSFISYIEAELQVTEIGRIGAGLPEPKSAFKSTGIFSQLSAVRADGGIGLLPSFLVDRDSGLVPVLRTQFARKHLIGAVVRTDSAASPSVQALVESLQSEMRSRARELAQ